MNAQARRDANISKKSDPAADDEKTKVVQSPQTNTGGHVRSAMAREAVQEPHERADAGAVMRPVSTVPAGEL